MKYPNKPSSSDAASDTVRVLEQLDQLDCGDAVPDVRELVARAQHLATEAHKAVPDY